MTSVKLNNGQEFPLVGFGTWRSGPNEVANAVSVAIDSGYRHIDCAQVYQNEKEIGDALKLKIGTTVKREELFITSKLWNTRHDPKDVLPACQKTLEDLQLDYLDLYLIHWPMAFENPNDFTVLFAKHENGRPKYADFPIEDTWKAMEKLVEAGLVKAIGLSNFNARQIDRIMACATIKPVVNQVESHPFLNQEKLLAHMKKYDLVMTAFSPLGSGSSSLIEHETVQTIAKAHNKSPAQVLIKFHTQRGVVTIPKSVTPERIVANLSVFDFELTQEELTTLLALNNNQRFCVPQFEENGVKSARDKAHPEFPFNDEY